MIRIKQPAMEYLKDYCRVICDIQIDDELHSIWFQVEKEYGKYLCTERADAYVIGLLSYAMRNGHDIYCDVPITDELLYGIEQDLIPTLSKYSKKLQHIKIDAKTAPALKCGFAVGTSASFGVDSFSSIYNHIDSKFSDLNLTHLCINNVGAFNECYADYGVQNVKNERYVIAEQIAAELGLPLVKTDSNFADEIYQNHLLTHTYSSVFAIYILQKLWKVYYLASSGEDYSNFSVYKSEKKDCALYDLLSLQCFSTSGLKIWSEGGAKTRLEKTKEIVSYMPAQKHLHVCLNKPYNCGICSKCRRTLVTLDLLDSLDLFDGTFDIAYYRANKKEYYAWLCYNHFIHDAMNEPVYQEFMKQLPFRLYACVEYVKNVFKAPFRFAMRVLRFVKRKLFDK